MASGQSLAAVRSGIAECTPNLRAAYEAAETTPRSSRCPPTTTALPFREGLRISSTETKNASISTWNMTRPADGMSLTIHQIRQVWADVGGAGITVSKSATYEESEEFLAPEVTAYASDQKALNGARVCRRGDAISRRRE